MLAGCEATSRNGSGFFVQATTNREAVDAHIEAAGKETGQFLSVGRRRFRHGHHGQHARLVSKWVAAIALWLLRDPFVARTKATLIDWRRGYLRFDRSFGHLWTERNGPMCASDPRGLT